MRLRTKFFLTYLLPLAAVILVLAVSVRGIAVRAAQSHMSGMMGGMMSGMADDIEQAMTRGLTEALAVGTGIGVLLALGASYVISSRLGSTAERLAQAAYRIADGRYDERVTYREEDEIGQFVASFNQMAERLENTEALRRELLGTISHELRTPLSNIQGYMEGLMDGVIAPEPQTYRLVYDEAARLTRLVAGIEGLSRVEAGVDELHLGPVEVMPLLEEAVQRMQPSWESKGIEPTVAVRPPAAVVWADRDRLLQVLTNLLENAFKYSAPEGRVGVVAAARGEVVEFRVSDTGRGIPEADLPHIFERFYRVDKSRSLSGGGVGIGLAVTKALVNRMGGTIRAESSVGEGTTIIFTLPRKGDSPADSGVDS